MSRHALFAFNHAVVRLALTRLYIFRRLQHAKRVTIMPKDIQLARRIRGERA